MIIVRLFYESIMIQRFCFSFYTKFISFNFAGGSTWRVLPSFISTWLLLSKLTTSNSSFYLHPYEFGRNINPLRFKSYKYNLIKILFLYLRWNINRKAIEKILRSLANNSNIAIMPISKSNKYKA